MVRAVNRKKPVAEKLRLELRVVFYREGHSWVAHCLEMDLMRHDAGKDGALRQLIEAIVLQIDVSIEANNYANIFMPADGRFFEMYAAGGDAAKMDWAVKGIRDSVMATEDVTISAVRAREYRGTLATA